MKCPLTSSGPAPTAAEPSPAPGRVPAPRTPEHQAGTAAATAAAKTAAATAAAAELEVTLYQITLSLLVPFHLHPESVRRFRESDTGAYTSLPSRCKNKDRLQPKAS